MVAFATVDDVEARWRPLSADESVQAATLLEDASDMIRVRWSDVDDRVAAGSLAAGSLVRVVAGMVKRAMLVGDAAGLESVTQQAGPFGLTQQVANPTGGLYLTAEDARLFDGYSTRTRMGWLL